MEVQVNQIFYKIKEGDETAFSQLRSAYRAPAFQFCLCLLKDEQEAEHVIEYAFENLWRERSALGNMDHFRAILFANLKKEIFEKMKEYDSPAAKDRFLNKISLAR